MLLKKFLLIFIILSFTNYSFSQSDLPETIVGTGNEDTKPDNPQLRILSVVTGVNDKLKNVPTVAQFNENFTKLDSRIEAIQLQTVSFIVAVLLINDAILISAFFILKGRGIL